MPAYLLLGFVLGIVTSVPPGPCNLAVVTTVTRGESMRRALATGAGAALADIVYSTLGIAGVGAVVSVHPTIPIAMQVASGVAMIAFGAIHLGGRADLTVDMRAPRGNSIVHGLATGLACALSNPAVMLVWVVVVGSAIGAPETVNACGTVAGIGAGTFTWFAIVAHLVRSGRRRGFAHAATIASALLVGGGVLSIARAALAFGSR